MTPRHLLTGVLSALSAIATAQISTTNEVIDCGQVIYNEPVTVQFELTNEGSTPISIKDIQTSCGCTTVNYPQGSLTHGKPFVVSAVYDARQLGHFEKYVDVYTSDSERPLMLTLRGVVVAERRGFSGVYDYVVGKLKTDCNAVEFDDVNRGERPVKEIHILTTSSETVTPVFMHLPSYLKADVSPSTVAPGKSCVARLSLESSELRDFGLTQTSVYLGTFIGDRISGDKEIEVSTVLLPDFAHLTENELANAPQIQVSTYNLDLGRFEKKKKKKGVVEIENIGKMPLEIRSLQMFTTGLKVDLSSQYLRPGETARLRITAERQGLRNARVKPRVLMITNDPTNAKVVINVNVE